MNNVTVHIKYFRLGGKYYSDGQLDMIYHEDMYRYFREVEELFKAGEYPGLTGGATPWVAIVDVPEHVNNFPRMYVLPLELHKVIKNLGDYIEGNLYTRGQPE